MSNIDLQQPDAPTQHSSLGRTASVWSLKNCIAVVTGATKGIGRAAAEELASFGAKVYLVARSSDELQRCVDELQAKGYDAAGLVADLSLSEQRKNLVHDLSQREQKIHVLVNNVGTNIRKSTTEYTDEEIRLLFETNLHSAFDLCRSLYTTLVAAGGASIINVASTNGLTYARTGSPYSMTKAALIHMSRYLAVEWAKDNIRVNAVAPWYIRTPLTEGVLSKPEYHDEVVSRTPLRRIGTVDEVAHTISFLALPASSYITGQCIAVDGGFTQYGF